MPQSKKGVGAGAVALTALALLVIVKRPAKAEPIIPIVPEPELPAPELIPGVIDLGEIEIISINGQTLYNVSGNTASLARPMTSGSLIKGISVKFRSKTISYDEWGIVGLRFHLWYEGVGMDSMCSSGPAFTGSVRAPMECLVPDPSYPSGCLPGAMGYSGLWQSEVYAGDMFAGGYWCPGIYNGSFNWARLYWDGIYGSGGSFHITNLIECTGKGDTG